MKHHREPSRRTAHCGKSKVLRENYWDEPDLARWLHRLGSYARVAMFDKRGTGMSDRVAELPGLDQRLDDLRAVMDAAGMEQTSVPAISEGGPLSVLFAAEQFEGRIQERYRIAKVR